MRRQAGYTLLELLVVLTIMGLLISAVPGVALPWVNAFSFSGKVEEVRSRLSTAHEKAVETGQTIVLSSSDMTISGVRILLPDHSSEIVFFPDGSASEVTLTLDYSGQHQTVEIDPITGLSTIR